MAALACVARRRTAAGLIILALGGCSTVGPKRAPRAPEAPDGFVRLTKAGPSWWELTGETVVLRTNLGLEEAKETLLQLEFTRAALLRAIFLDERLAEVRHHLLLTMRDRLEVVAFATEEELREYLPSGEASYRRDIDGEWILLGGGLDRYYQRQAIAHELAH